MTASGGGRRRRLTAAVAVALLLPATYVVLDAADIVPGLVTSDLGHEDRPAAAAPGAAARTPGAAGEPTGPTAAASAPDASPPGATAGSTAGSTAGATEGTRAGAAAADAAQVPAPADRAAPPPTTAGLRRTLARAVADPRLGPSVGIEVRDADGQVVFGKDADRARTPASATKVLTAAAVAAAEDLTGRFTTRAVLVPADSGPDTLVLVAGGDNLLAPDHGTPGAVAGRAGLGDLARASAAALTSYAGERGARPVRVRLDDSFARGPALAPGWAADDIALGLTGPVAMLGLSTDRAVPYRPATRDPALHATSAFAAALTRAGVDVVGAAARLPGAAPGDATPLAAVESAPVGDVLALALDDSDNDLTESVARWACARAQAPTTFPGCAAWVRDRLVDAGLDVTGVRLADTSGLSGGTLAPVSVISAAVAAGASGTQPGLAQVLSRLPVAGLSGTLDERFRGPGAAAGVGVVRAKTGTLTGVSALAGSVVDADGHPLTFAVVADRVPPAGTEPARAALDALASTLAGCGCR